MDTTTVILAGFGFALSAFTLGLKVGIVVEKIRAQRAANGKSE